MEPRVTIVVTCRETDTPDTTLKSLMDQDYQNYELIVARDEGKGANYARNKGFRKVDTEFVLFSDDDIIWRKDGITNLLEALKSHPDKSYAYGAYSFTNKDLTQCNRPFNGEDLKRGNYISTMSLVRTKDFPGFDESLKRFQDWDVWLTMLEQGKEGVWCGQTVFDTEYVEHGDGTEDEEILIKKHAL
jgi:glycosyltransferase involved in cell wall biosynthesis